MVDVVVEPRVVGWDLLAVGFDLSLYGLGECVHCGEELG